jgi:hypothetical protein
MSVTVITTVKIKSSEITLGDLRSFLTEATEMGIDEDAKVRIHESGPWRRQEPGNVITYSLEVST